MDEMCPFCNELADVLTLDAHIKGCVAYNATLTKIEAFKKDIDKLQKAIDDRKQKQDENTTALVAFETLKKKYPKLLELALATRSNTNIETVFNMILKAGSTKKYLKETKKLVKEEAKEIISNLDVLKTAKDKVVKSTKKVGKKLNINKESVTKAGNCIYNVAVVVAAGLAIFFLTILIYQAVFGVIDLKIATGTSFGLTFLSKGLYQKKKYGKKMFCLL